MTSEALLAVTKPTPSNVVKQMQVHGWTWKTGGVVFGLCGGIISPLIGSLLTVIAWFTGPEWHGLHLHRTGTLLFVLTFPLLAFGAHCLDLLDRKDQEARKPHSK